MTTSDFQKLADVANRVAAYYSRSRSTCILTSFALSDALQRMGYNSRPLRIEAAVFPDDPKLYGTILGAIDNGGNGRRPAAAPDKWCGHLAVVVDDEWLLDATLDQANKKNWPQSMRVGPLAVRLPQEFWTEQKVLLLQVNESTVRFILHPRQVGFAYKPDARPSHWRPLAEMILRALEGEYCRQRKLNGVGAAHRGNGADDPLNETVKDMLDWLAP
jgi:hypothetical protein